MQCRMWCATRKKKKKNAVVFALQCGVVWSYCSSCFIPTTVVLICCCCAAVFLFFVLLLTTFLTSWCCMCVFLLMFLLLFFTEAFPNACWAGCLAWLDEIKFVACSDRPWLYRRRIIPPYVLLFSSQYNNTFEQQFSSSLLGIFLLRHVTAHEMIFCRCPGTINYIFLFRGRYHSIFSSLSESVVGVLALHTSTWWWFWYSYLLGDFFHYYCRTVTTLYSCTCGCCCLLYIFGPFCLAVALQIQKQNGATSIDTCLLPIWRCG